MEPSRTKPGRRRSVGASMSTDWDELRERARRAAHDDGVLRYLHGEVSRLAALRDERGRRFAAEARDVKELEDFSLGWLLERWLGMREKRVERDLREQLSARLAFEEV